MMKIEQGLRNASQMIRRCQNMLYSERRKELHLLLLKIPVLSEGEGMALPLSEHTKGKKGNLEKVAGSGSHLSWLYHLKKGIHF